MAQQIINTASINAAVGGTNVPTGYRRTSTSYGSGLPASVDAAASLQGLVPVIGLQTA